MDAKWTTASLQTSDGLSYRCAGFWLRLAAYFIDLVVLSLLNLPITIITFIMLASVKGTDTETGRAGLEILCGAFLISNLLCLCYYSLFECTKQATPGKMCFGLIVTGNDAKKLSFGQALARNLSKYISTLLLGFGYLMAAFTAHKQALHDLMSGCFVLQQHNAKESTWSPTHHKHGTTWKDATPQYNGSLDLTGLNRAGDSAQKSTAKQPDGTMDSASESALAAWKTEAPAIKIPKPAVPMAEPPAIRIPDPAVPMAAPPAIKIPDPAVPVALPSAIKIPDQAVPLSAPFAVGSASSSAAPEPCRKCGMDLDPNFSFCLACSTSRES